MSLVNLQLAQITLTKYSSLTEEEKELKNIIYFVYGTDYNYLYYRGRCYGKVVPSTVSSDVKIVRVGSEIELPTIGDKSSIYVVDSADSIYGTIYMWSEDNLRYINGSDTWMGIKAIKGGDATSA